MPDELDLSDVAPLKWAEVRKRVGVIREYLAIAHPTRADREHHADLLGLRTGQFYNLVRAWKIYRRPSALTTGIRDVAKPSRSRRNGVDPRARAIAKEAIAEFGRAAPLAKLVATINERCAAEGVRAPSRGTVWGLTRESGGATGTGPTTGLLLAHAFLRLPILSHDGVELPTAMLLVEVPGGRIVESAIAEPGPSDAMDRMTCAIRTRLRDERLPVIATEGDVDRLEPALPDARLVRESGPAIARLLASTVGTRIGHVELRTRRPRVDAGTVMQSARDTPLTRHEAEDALRIAREHHNRAINQLPESSG